MSKVTKEAWGEALRGHIEAMRRETPLPARDSLNPDEEFRCRILGGTLIGWLERWGPRLLQERSVVAWKEGTDKEPLIVVTTDIPGLVATHEILGGEMGRILYCLRSEFKSFKPEHPDPEFLIHCVFDNYFEPNPDPAELESLRSQYGLPADTPLAIHSETSTLGPLFARGARHLWSFAPPEPKLVEEAFSTWIS